MAASPQEEVGHLRHYELMVILDPDLEERTIAPSLDTFLNVVRTGGGTVEKVDVWGRRRLSFEVLPARGGLRGCGCVRSVACQGGAR